MDRFLKQQERTPRQKNPYFSHESETALPKKKKLRIVFISAVVAFLLIVIVLIPTVFRNSSYNIKLAIFTGNTRIPDQTIIKEVNRFLSGNHMLIIPKKNILFLPKNALADDLESVFHFKEVTVDALVAERKIHIQVAEKPLEYIIQIDAATHYLSQDGSILEEIPEDQREQKQSQLLTIRLLDETLTDEDGNAKTGITEDLLDLASLVKNFFQNIPDVAPQIIEIATEDSEDVKIYTDHGWYIHIDRTTDIQRQLEVAREIIREKKNAEESINEYIDVRIPDRAFVK